MGVANDFFTEDDWREIKNTREFLQSQDIADAILYLLSTPLRVQVRLINTDRIVYFKPIEESAPADRGQFKFFSFFR